MDAWLTKAGWHPGRRCDGIAAAEAESAVESFRNDGGSLDVIAPALDFLREHVGLVAPLHTSPEDTEGLPRRARHVRRRDDPHRPGGTIPLPASHRRLFPRRRQVLGPDALFAGSSARRRAHA
ncbi:SUKH-3 domain-containing protein [Streptomyces echinatus]|uniref:SUKH-3 domain-containing protein n=1 Tax=Streptomyces echinatus TaxID=67293 RepID=UPI0031E75CEE